MSTAILPDESVVVRLEARTIHIDASGRSIDVRAASARHELGGSVLASWPIAAADRVRLLPSAEGRFSLALDLSTGLSLGLGEAPSREVAMLTARTIADLTRCKVEVAQGESRLPGQSATVPAVRRRGPDPFEAPTGRIPWAPPAEPAVAPAAAAAEPWAEATEVGEDTSPPLEGSHTTIEPAEAMDARAEASRGLEALVDDLELRGARSPRSRARPSSLAAPPAGPEAPEALALAEATTFDAPSAPPLADAEAPAALVDEEALAPVFMQLLVESQLAEAARVDPRAPVPAEPGPPDFGRFAPCAPPACSDLCEEPPLPASARPPVDDDRAPTVVGLGPMGPPEQRRAALRELLGLVMEELPIAPLELPPAAGGPGGLGPRRVESMARARPRRRVSSILAAG